MSNKILHGLRQRLGSQEHLHEIVLFGLVGGFGTVLNTAILYVLTAYAGMHYLVASAIATELAIISNFFGNHWFTFKHRKGEASLGCRFATFQMVSMASLVCTLGILWVLTTSFGEKLLLVWNLVAILGAFGLNFLLNRKFTWKEK